MAKYKHKDAMNNLSNYLAIVALVPAVLSVLAYEFLDYVVNVWFHQNESFNPLNGLGILIPMAMLMELFAFFFGKALYKDMSYLLDGLSDVAKGDFNITLDTKPSGPLIDAKKNFNRMSEELRSVQTLRNDFINDFSHEFKTPISSINGFAKLLLDTEVSEAERREYLQIIADESDRLSTLAEDTMLMSRLDNQSSILDVESFSLTKQIKQSIILLSNEWSVKNINLTADLPPVTYFGNADLMAHVWINLLNNAIKFTPENGTIMVSMTADDEIIRVAITDSGKGMTDEQINHIFNKYYQTDSSHATKGLGLGLSITYRIIELCNGRIEVISTPNSGSTFTVLLPVTASNSVIKGD